MNYYGIKGPLIKWFENYVYQRKQKVINRATSSTVCERSSFLSVDSLQMILQIFISLAQYPGKQHGD
jgi:hypothetical protein